MKKMAVVFLGLTLLWACQGPGTDKSSIQQTKTIILYGSNNCDHCVDFKAQLDSMGLAYDFRDVEFNEIQANEMFTKVQMARITGQIKYPVLDIEGRILVAPELRQVLVLME